MADTFDLTVIGGGIVGLATAMKIAEYRPGLTLLLLEKEPRLAGHQTGHNSGVIHSGIYYRPGSSKARNCVAGRQALIEFCDRYGIPYELSGKVVVATRDDELPRLEELRRRGEANGVQGLEMIGPERLREIEPHAGGLRALYVPATGIVDFKKVAEALAARIRESGGEIRTAHEVRAIAERDGELVLESASGECRTRYLINCAGLQSDLIASEMIRNRGGVSETGGEHRIIPFRGEYYKLVPQKKHLVRNLIYPVPDPAFPFLGVHFTRRLDGEVEAGPNAVLALAREGYRKTDLDFADLCRIVSFPGFWAMAVKYWRTGLGELYRSLSKGAFAKALRRLVPEISADDLVPGGAGVRAQAVSASGALVDDFVILRSGNAVHVLNAPSPGATASLAIGEHIAKLAADALPLVS